MHGQAIKSTARMVDKKSGARPTMEGIGALWRGYS